MSDVGPRALDCLRYASSRLESALRELDESMVELGKAARRARRNYDLAAECSAAFAKHLARYLEEEAETKGET